MPVDALLRVGQEAVYLALLLSAGPVLLALVIGLIVSVLQAATGIQEQTLSFAPKVAAIAVLLIVAGAYLLGQVVAFTEALLTMVPEVG